MVVIMAAIKNLLVFSLPQIAKIKAVAYMARIRMIPIIANTLRNIITSES